MFDFSSSAKAATLNLNNYYHLYNFYLTHTSFVTNHILNSSEFLSYANNLATEEATTYYQSEFNTNQTTNGYVAEYQDAYTSAFECVSSYRIENLSTCFECEQYKYTNPSAYTDCKQRNNCYGYSSCLECETYTGEAKDSCLQANNCAICQECIEAPESELLACQLENRCTVTPSNCTEALNKYYQANTIANVHAAIKNKAQAIVAQNIASGAYNSINYFFDGPTPKAHTIAALNTPAITQSAQYTAYLNNYYNQVDWQPELLTLVNQNELTLHYMPQVEQIWLAEAETKAQLSNASVVGIIKTIANLAHQPTSTYKVPELLQSITHLYGPTASSYLLNTNGASTAQQKPMAFLQHNLVKQTLPTQIVTTAGPSVYYLYGSSRLGEQKHYAGTSTGSIYHHQEGSLSYEYTDHLGNVKLTTNNRLKLHYRNNSLHLEPTLLSSLDYYPFGMVMPGRSFNSNSYRYGFNGMERDDEVKGNGNSYDFGARIYDPRLGRWLSLDGMASEYPSESPYGYAGNNPIANKEVDGNYYIFYRYGNLTIAVTPPQLVTSADIATAIPNLYASAGALFFRIMLAVQDPSVPFPGPQDYLGLFFGASKALGAEKGLLKADRLGNTLLEANRFMISAATAYIGTDEYEMVVDQVLVSRLSAKYDGQVHTEDDNQTAVGFEFSQDYIDQVRQEVIAGSTQKLSEHEIKMGVEERITSLVDQERQAIKSEINAEAEKQSSTSD